MEASESTTAESAFAIRAVELVKGLDEGTNGRTIQREEEDEEEEAKGVANMQ